MEKHLYLVANWKSNKTFEEARDFLNQYSTESPHRVVICPSMPFIALLKDSAEAKKLHLGAQDVSNYPPGAYTGAVCADMLKGWVDYVIVGHSERRKYFHETNDVVASKAKLALEAGITPILCVDQPYLEPQLAFFEAEELKKMIIAYEPFAAIGSGQPDSPEEAEKVAEKITRLAQIDLPVIYGGSVDAQNVRGFVEQKQIAGVLVGGTSLGIQDWQLLVQAVS